MASKIVGVNKHGIPVAVGASARLRAEFEHKSVDNEARQGPSKRAVAFWNAGHKTCWLCGERVDICVTGRKRATVDHVHPVSHGGPDGKHNLRMAHADCNANRGDADCPMCIIGQCSGAVRRAAVIAAGIANPG